jgi:hypothetical protein
MNLSAPFAGFAALQAGDVLTTAWALSTGAREANPIARFLLDNAGVPALGLAKLAVILAAFLIVGAMPARGFGLARFTLQTANVVMAFVVLSNIGIALR